MAVLCGSSPSWKQPKCPSTVRQKPNCSALTQKWEMRIPSTQMNLPNSTLGKGSQTQKSTYCTLPWSSRTEKHICGFRSQDSVLPGESRCWQGCQGSAGPRQYFISWSVSWFPRCIYFVKSNEALWLGFLHITPWILYFNKTGLQEVAGLRLRTRLQLDLWASWCVHCMGGGEERAMTL